MPEPGSKEYEEMVDFMREDLGSNMGYSKIEKAARKLLKEQGRDFDKEFAKWQAEKHECTYIGKDDTYLETDMYVCNNCGSSGESIEAIHHHGTCRKCVGKKWEEFYSKNNDEEVI
jgi:hypothetical protein